MSINIIDAAGATQTVNTLPALGLSGASTSLPVAVSSDLVSGSITTQNLVPAGAATAGSAVEIAVSGYASISVQVTGTYTGALTLQATIDGSTWVSMSGGGTLINISNGAGSSTIASAAQSIYQADIGGFTRARITALAAVTGTASIVLRTAQGASAVAIDAPLPTGTNSVGNIGTVGTLSTLTAGNLAIPGTIADVLSAALTSTTTTATLTPTFGCSYEVNVPVTVVSGTTPTLDFVIQESDDSGVNWFDVYHFERITATGIYRSPKLPLTGNRVRYVQTVSGTTPSFTRSVNRLQSSDTVVATRRLFDRSLASTQALNAVTASLNSQNLSYNFQLIISSGTITTTAPVLKLQGSDDNGATWYDIPGTTLTAVASSTVQITAVNYSAQLVRAIVTTAGSAATLNYVSLKAF